MESITSEQELKTLLEDGKITQEEYKELLAAMKDKPRQNGIVLTPDSEAKSNAKTGKAAMILCIISIILPELIFLFSWFLAGLKDGTGSNIGAIFVILLVLTEFVCVILAIVLGIVAWKTTMGKIAVLGAVFISGCEILLLFTIMAYKASEIRSGAIISVEQTYKTYSCDSLDSLIVGQTGSPVEKGVFSEDNGAIKIQVLQADTFHLYETGPLENANNTMLFYRAKVRTEALAGKGYLELWCSIPGKGEFFSRGLDQPIYGTNNWTTMQIPFRNDSGINPDNIKLNLVVLGQGTGTIWIDDIQVTGNPL